MPKLDAAVAGVSAASLKHDGKNKYRHALLL
jgi:hypothetical protein